MESFAREIREHAVKEGGASGSENRERNERHERNCGRCPRFLIEQRHFSSSRWALAPVFFQKTTVTGASAHRLICLGKRDVFVAFVSFVVF